MENYFKGFGGSITYIPTETIEVDNLKDLKKALRRTEPLKINITADIQITKSISTHASNKSICGVNSASLIYNNRGRLYFLHSENITFTNLTFIGVKSETSYCQDLITFSNVNGIGIDNCTFIEGRDEQIGIKNDCDNITIQNSVFRRNVDSTHNYSILIGQNDAVLKKENPYHVTLYNCTFEGINYGRMPRVRNCVLELDSCTFNSNCAEYYLGLQNADVTATHCTFTGVCKEVVKKYGEYTIKYIDCTSDFPIEDVEKEINTEENIDE